MSLSLQELGCDETKSIFFFFPAEKGERRMKKDRRPKKLGSRRGGEKKMYSVSILSWNHEEGKGMEGRD
jgi:hypothetical protein